MHCCGAMAEVVKARSSPTSQCGLMSVIGLCLLFLMQGNFAEANKSCCTVTDYICRMKPLASSSCGLEMRTLTSYATSKSISHSTGIVTWQVSIKKAELDPLSDISTSVELPQTHGSNS